MTNTNATNTPTNGDVSTYNVIAVTFGEDANAYAALTILKELAAQGQIEVHEAAVVERDAGGAVTVKSRVGGDDLKGTATGGMIGLLVGVIGGPVGMLLGGSYGLLFGSLIDLDEEERTETTLGEISKSVQAERTAMLAVVTEPSPEVIGAAMTTLGGTVLRRSVFDVEAEVAAVEKAERKAAHEARKEVLRAKRDHTREAAHAKVEELKAKVRHTDTEKAGV